MAEGVAMLLHIADAFPERNLAPLPGSIERAHHDRWLMYFAVNVYEGELRKVRPEAYTDDPGGDAAVRSCAERYVEKHYLIYEAVLGEGPYYFGDRFTMLDIYVWMLSQWMDQDWLTRHCPKIARLARTVAARTAIAPIHASHFSDDD
jgi:glutathione S-transferase